MSDNGHIKQQLEQRQQRWKTLYEKQQIMQASHDRETRAEEKFRLKPLLDETRAEMTVIEADIQTLQTQFNQGEIQRLRTELATLRRNKAYPQALDIARQIAALAPNDPQASEDVSELQQQLERGKQAQQVFARLTAHFVDLQPIMTDLAYVLNPRNEHEQMEVIANIAQNFLAGSMQASDFMVIFQKLFSEQAVNARSNTTTQQYARIADSIRKGRTVLFLGSAIPHLYNNDSDNEQTLACHLAEEIQYQNFSGSLSSIAEYYQLSPGGRNNLLETLHKLLQQQATLLPLYASLARTPANIIVISATYDTLLEQAFRASGKAFVEMASIIIPHDDYKLGSVVLTYSDREGEDVCPQEDLSTLGLLKDYSIIYKIRGSCDERSSNLNQPWRNAITLTESNYFAFAEHASKIIPDYLSRELRDREFLFIGFSPARWEDRLLAHALLLKRPSYSELCYTIGKANDPLQAAFWEHRKVRQSDMEFAELDRHLQEATQ